MKHKIVLIFSLIIFSNSIASAKLVNNPSNEGDEEVKVLVLKKSKNYRIINIDNAFRTNEEEDYPVVIKIGDRFNIKKEDGEKLNGYLGKIIDEGTIVIIDRKGLIVGEAELSKIIHIEHKHNSYMIDDKRYSVKIKTRIITEKSKRKKEVGRSILGKTIWTIFGIAGTALAFKFFVLKD